MKLTHNQKVRGLQIINHLLLLVGIWYVVTTQDYGMLGLSFVMYVITGMLGVNIGMHRLLSHRSFETYGWIEKLLSVISVVTTIGSPLAWSALHRQHHKFCETDKDPHSPYKDGKFTFAQAFKSWVGLWDLVTISPKMVKDLRRIDFQKALHKYYLSIIVVYCIALALINPWLIVFVYAIPACLCLHSTSTIIVIAHRHGYRTHDLKHDQSRNSWIAHLLSLGEGWHNNHHANGGKWNTQEKWWEIDPPALVIRLIKK
jgi:stearoyl-CoA desaturase (delta-9 desaturase)